MKFTSDTTSGTSGSLRHADELSITVTPAAANRGACTSDIVLPGGEQRDVQTGRVRRRGVFDFDLLAAEGSLRPCERAEAKNRIVVAGKSRSSSSLRITWPTCPVAPTTPIATI